MSENKEFLANFIAEFQSKNQQKFVEMRSESPELLSAIENVLGFLKGKYELDTPIELVPESAIPIAVVQPTAPIQTTTKSASTNVGEIPVLQINVDVDWVNGDLFTERFWKWDNANEFLRDNFRSAGGYTGVKRIYLDIRWENGFVLKYPIIVPTWLSDIGTNLSEYLRKKIYSLADVNNEQNQTFREFDKLQFEDANVSQTQSVVTPNAPTTQPQPILGGSIKVSTIKVIVLSKKRGQKFEQESITWDSAQEFVTRIVGDRLSLVTIANVDINVTWENTFEFRWTLTTKSFFTDIKNDLSEFVETLVKDGLNLRNQSFKDYDKLSFQDANVSQTQNVKTSKPQPTLVNIQPTGNEIQLKSFVFTLEDSQKGLIEADGVLWSELNDIFQKSFERNTFQKLKIDVEWEDDFLIVETIYYDDIDAMEMLENTTSIGTFIYTNWTLFTTTQGKVRSNYAFSDFLPSITTPVATQASSTATTSEEKIPLKKYSYTYHSEDDVFMDASNTWSRLQDNFSSTFNLTDFQVLQLELEWQDGLVVDIDIDANDTDSLEELNAYPDINGFIYENWDSFTSTIGKVRSNYAFSDSLATNTASVASSPTKSGIVLLDTIEVYLHTTTSILPYEYENFDGAAIEISRILKNSTLLDVEKVRVNVFWKDGSDIQFVFYKADNGYAYLKRNILKNPTALIRYTRQAFELRFPAEDMDNYEGLKITGRSTATITTSVPTQASPTTPAKRGRPKKVPTASQSSTATTSTPKVKKKIDEVKTADDLIDLDLDDLEI